MNDIPTNKSNSTIWQILRCTNIQHLLYLYEMILLATKLKKPKGSQIGQLFLILTPVVSLSCYLTVVLITFP